MKLYGNRCRQKLIRNSRCITWQKVNWNNEPIYIRRIFHVSRHQSVWQIKSTHVHRTQQLPLKNVQTFYRFTSTSFMSEGIFQNTYFNKLDYSYREVGALRNFRQIEIRTKIFFDWIPTPRTSVIATTAYNKTRWNRGARFVGRQVLWRIHGEAGEWSFPTNCRGTKRWNIRVNTRPKVIATSVADASSEFPIFLSILFFRSAQTAHAYLANE